MTTPRLAHVRSAGRVVLGGALIIAGFGHLTFARKDFRADAARRNRLFFQPVLVAWAWWSADAFAVLRRSRRD